MIIFLTKWMILLDDLIHYDLDDYQKCIKEFGQQLLKLDYFVSLYQFGSIRFPGISDIDLLIVIDSLVGFNKKRNRILKKMENIPNSSYFFYHPPVIISKNDLLYIGLFFDPTEPKFLLGKFNLIISIYKYGCEQVINWNCYFYQSLLNLVIAQSISLRLVLLNLNNVATSIRNNDNLNGMHYYRLYKKKVDRIREKCLERADVTEDIIKLLLEALRIINIQENSESGFESLLPNFLVSFKEKKIFIFGKRLALLDMKMFQIYFFPKRYFTFYKRLKELVSEMPFDYRKMRERFLGVKFFNY